MTTAVYGEDEGNGIAALRWAPGHRVAGDFAGGYGTDVTDGKFTVEENGAYTVYVRDLAGLDAVYHLDVNRIVKQAPLIEHNYDSTEPRRSSIAITVTATVHGTDAGNDLAALMWAVGSHSESDFAGGTLGEDITTSGMFTVASNGSYTIYARDIAGNEAVTAIAVTRIGASSSGSSGSVACSADICISLAQGEARTLEIEGLTLSIPAGATNRSLMIMVDHITSELLSEERLIGQGYEMSTSVPDPFLKPITLELRFDPAALGDRERAAVFYYDEERQRWIELDGTKRTGIDTVQGETDRFAKFAVHAVQDDTADPSLEEPEASFFDMDGHWAASSIVRAARIGLVSGYEDGSFQPNRAVTRAEFTVMLARAIPLTGDHEITFKDRSSIPPWSRQAVAAAVASGILSGYDDGTFRPQGLINRSEMAVMAAKAAGLTPQDGAETPFADNATIPAWSKPYVAAAYEAGWISGRGGNRFAPVDALTRAEAVVLLLGMIDASR